MDKEELKKILTQIKFGDGLLADKMGVELPIMLKMAIKEIGDLALGDADEKEIDELIEGWLPILVEEQEEIEEEAKLYRQLQPDSA